MAIHYDGRLFRPVTNAPNGQVCGETLFRYSQSGAVLTAGYSGGGIRTGSMLGLVQDDGSLRFCYHHLTDAGELRSGVCDSRPEILDDGRIRLHESWRWTLGADPATAEGHSIVEEVPSPALDGK